MKIIESDITKDLELPLQLYISFKEVFEYYNRYAEDKYHPYYKSAQQITNHLAQFPESFGKKYEL